MVVHPACVAGSFVYSWHSWPVYSCPVRARLTKPRSAAGLRFRFACRRGNSTHRFILPRIRHLGQHPRTLSPTPPSLTIDHGSPVSWFA